MLSEKSVMVDSCNLVLFRDRSEQDELVEFPGRRFRFGSSNIIW